jgi:hypothetical protein
MSIGLCMLVLAMYAQKAVPFFSKDSMQWVFQKIPVPINKQIPDSFLIPIRTALLYYPELQQAKIKFVVRKQASPLSASINFFSVFRKASKKQYVIHISNQVKKRFDGIRLSNLSFNAQVGVIGHELGHISYYYGRSSLVFVQLALMHLSKRKVDAHEYGTDMICIHHHLGYQLLEWSKEVRRKLNIAQWKGIKQLAKHGRERYMNPESILRVIMNYEL